MAYKRAGEGREGGGFKAGDPIKLAELRMDSSCQSEEIANLVVSYSCPSLSVRKRKKHLFSWKETRSVTLSLSHIRCDLRLTLKKGEIIYKARRGGMIDRPRIYRGANERKNSTKKGGERETREVKYTSALLILRVG